MRTFVTTAARNDVHVYTIDPRGLDPRDELVEAPTAPGLSGDPSASLKYFDMLESGKRLSVETVRAWAEETGGVSVVSTNDVEAGLERIVQENSRYYALGYYSTADPNDGRLHRVDVRVKRAGLSVRAPRGYVANRVSPAGEAGAAARTSAASALDQALALPVEDDRLRLRASAVSGEREPPLVPGPRPACRAVGRSLPPASEGARAPDQLVCGSRAVVRRRPAEPLTAGCVHARCVRTWTPPFTG
jgi:hypothetical protein